MKGKYFKVLDNGFVGLVDYLGDDFLIEQCARVSYQKGTRQVSDARSLIRYLVRNNHTSPLEAGEMMFHVKMPLHTVQQILRHRTFSFNQESLRYSECACEFQVTDPDDWRTQSADNKQGSSGFVTKFPSENYLFDVDDYEWAQTAGKYLTEMERRTQETIKERYQERLDFGVAKEQARKDLPVSTYTQLFFKADIRNLLHFLYLRCDEHAQLEIRSYANVIAAIVKEVFPLTFEAFHDYRMDVITFTRAEWKALQDYVFNNNYLTFADNDDHGPYLQTYGITNKREQKEFTEKVRRFDNPPKTFNIADFEQLDMN